MSKKIVLYLSTFLLLLLSGTSSINKDSAHQANLKAELFSTRNISIDLVSTQNHNQELRTKPSSHSKNRYNSIVAIEIEEEDDRFTSSKTAIKDCSNFAIILLNHNFYTSEITQKLFPALSCVSNLTLNRSILFEVFRL